MTCILAELMAARDDDKGGLMGFGGFGQKLMSPKIVRNFVGMSKWVYTMCCFLHEVKF